MGLALAVIVWFWNKGEHTRWGRRINTAFATIVALYAFLVALAITNAVIFTALGI